MLTASRFHWIVVSCIVALVPWTGQSALGPHRGATFIAVWNFCVARICQHFDEGSVSRKHPFGLEEHCLLYWQSQFYPGTYICCFRSMIFLIRCTCIISGTALINHFSTCIILDSAGEDRGDAVSDRYLGLVEPNQGQPAFECHHHSATLRFRTLVLRSRQKHKRWRSRTTSNLWRPLSHDESSIRPRL